MQNTTTLQDLERDLKASLDADKEAILESQYPEDLVHEYVDSKIPIYNYTLLEVVMNDLTLGYGPEDGGLAGDESNIYDIIGIAIYERLSLVAYEWLEENKESI